MARYFFHIKDGSKVIADPDGTDLPSVVAAREEVMEAARELLAERIEAGEIIDGQEFLVCDVWGNTLLTIPVISVLRLE